MNATDVVSNLGAMLASGGVEVVDCTGVLGPNTPILQLPPDFAKNTPTRAKREAGCSNLM